MCKDKSRISEQRTLEHFNDKSTKYSFASEKKPWSYIRKREEIAFLNVLHKMSLHHDCNIMELGCGAGFYSKKLQHFTSNPLVLVDFSKSMLEKIKIKNSKKICCNINTFKRIQPFDLIVAMGVLEFSANINNFFKIISENLDINGHAILMTPMYSILSIPYYLYHLKNGISLKYLRKKHLHINCDHHGFEIISRQFVFPFNTLIVLKKA